MVKWRLWWNQHYARHGNRPGVSYSLTKKLRPWEALLKHWFHEARVREDSAKSMKERQAKNTLPKHHNPVEESIAHRRGPAVDLFANRVLESCSHFPKRRGPPIFFNKKKPFERVFSYLRQPRPKLVLRQVTPRLAMPMGAPPRILSEQREWINSPFQLTEIYGDCPLLTSVWPKRRDRASDTRTEWPFASVRHQDPEVRRRCQGRNEVALRRDAKQQCIKSNGKQVHWLAHRE